MVGAEFCLCTAFTERIVRNGEVIALFGNIFCLRLNELKLSTIKEFICNSDFIYMLNQAAGDSDILAEKLHISKEQMKFVTNSGQGEGLIRYDKVLLPFTDKFPTDTKMYALMTTRPQDQT